jgi:cytochrome P450
VTWALYALSKQPEYQIEIHREVMAVMPDNVPTFETLDKLEFTDRVLKETLRVYPPAWSLFLRDVLEDIPLGDRVIPKGGIIYISPYVQHHLPKYWDHPDDFAPSRFEGDWKDRIPNYVYMPFGGGPRICLGSHMAEMESRVILATIMKQFSVEVANPDDQVWMNASFTLRPYPNLPLRVRKRT